MTNKQANSASLTEANFAKGRLRALWWISPTQFENGCVDINELDTDNRPILFFIEHTAEGETYKISK
jgi:hypothetical protein